MPLAELQSAASALVAVTRTQILDNNATFTHNTAMLQKFYSQQLGAPSAPSQLLVQLITRDFGSWPEFEVACLDAAVEAHTGWVILGLCFADFKFHLFAVNDHMPFCISPMMCCPATELAHRSDHEGMNTAAYDCIRRLNWAVVSSRVECLQEPLDLFSDPTDCASAPCGDFEASDES